MSKIEKLILKLKNNPKDFSFNELKKLLNNFGYIELKLGKTSGSRVAFINEKSKHIIRIHKPHPSEILKSYQIEYIIEELEKIGLI